MTAEQGSFTHDLEVGRPKTLSWQEILALDPDHEPHLETPEGRFSAALNIIKTGAMVLELAALSEATYQDFKLINSRASEIYRKKLCEPHATKKHLSRTISAVGAAAKSDIDDVRWRRTIFGTALLPAAIYVWEQILDLEINPAKTLASQSSIKKDANGNIVDSAPYARAKILIDIREGTLPEQVELARHRNLTNNPVRNHLQNLKDAGLVNFESADFVDSFTFFTTTETGKCLGKWPALKNGGQIKLSADVDLAIVGLATEGKETFTTQDIIDWTKKNNPVAGKSAKHLSHVNSVLSFFVNQGLLIKSQFSKNHLSDITLTEKGEAFLQKVLLPLFEWARDPNSVLEINRIRTRLAINPEDCNDVLKNIAAVYRKTSPNVNKDRDSKTGDIISLIMHNQGELTPSQVAKRLGINQSTVARIVKPLIASGTVIAEHSKMGRMYLSVKV